MSTHEKNSGRKRSSIRGEQNSGITKVFAELRRCISDSSGSLVGETKSITQPPRSDQCIHRMRQKTVHVKYLSVSIGSIVDGYIPKLPTEPLPNYKLLISITLNSMTFVVLGGSWPPPMINSLFCSFNTRKCLVYAFFSGVGTRFHGVPGSAKSVLT